MELIKKQLKENTQEKIKKIIQLSKSIDLDVLNNIKSENDSESFFDLSDDSYKISQALNEIEIFCKKIRSI